jgi:hypothetical protein
MTENNIKEISSLIDDLNPELERNYLSIKEQTAWKMDWNMLLYCEEDESGFKIDWNKLLYNEEQLEEFNLQRQEKLVQPDKYEYLFENPTHRTPMELFYLKQAGYEVEEIEEDNETIIKKLIVTGLLREV